MSESKKNQKYLIPSKSTKQITDYQRISNHLASQPSTNQTVLFPSLCKSNGNSRYLVKQKNSHSSKCKNNKKYQHQPSHDYYPEKHKSQGLISLQIKNQLYDQNSNKLIKSSNKIPSMTKIPSRKINSDYKNSQIQNRQEICQNKKYSKKLSDIFCKFLHPNTQNNYWQPKQQANQSSFKNELNINTSSSKAQKQCQTFQQWNDKQEQLTAFYMKNLQRLYNMNIDIKLQLSQTNLNNPKKQLP